MKRDKTNANFISYPFDCSFYKKTPEVKAEFEKSSHLRVGHLIYFQGLWPFIFECQVMFVVGVPAVLRKWFYENF
jgi:hypothetical protein